jgi:subtilisin-like proprotein convertase family protein
VKLKRPTFIIAVILTVVLLGVFASTRTTPSTTLTWNGQRGPGANPAMQTGKPEEAEGPIVSEEVVPSLSKPLTEIAPLPVELQLDRELNPRVNAADFLQGTVPDSDEPDPLVARSHNPNGLTPPVELSFDGIDFTTGGTGSPPDTVGDVGPNHYMQSVNGSFRIFNKSGTALTAVAANNTIWSGAGGRCESRNDGDPIVLYDELADRWFFAQFVSASPYRVCIAISQTANPTGAWYRYEFTPGSELADYLKFGVWNNAYYMSANESTYTAYAFDRTAMLTGGTATFIKFTGQTNLLMPADLDGSTAPPAGSSGLFYTFKDNSFHGGTDRLELFAFTPNFVTPASSTFTLIHTLTTSAFTYTVCGFFVLDCVPQQGSSEEVDAVSEWPMFRLGYRNFGTHQSLVGNFAVDVGSDRSGIRWFELRNSGGGWSLFQEGTHAPGTEHRFMGSIAQDQQGNIALGYNTSSGTMFPALRYTTRLTTDAAGTLGTEVTLHAGTGSQTSTHSRWGDYSALSVDPGNDCTFWFTGEYFSTSGGNWRTRIGTFTIPECLRLTSNVSSVQICQGQNAVYTLTAGSGYSGAVTLSGSGNPAPSTLLFSPNPISPPFPANATATIGNTASVAPGTYNLTFTGTAGAQVSSVATTLTVISAPSAPTLTAPANNAIIGSTTPTLTWAAVASATSYTVEVATDPSFTTIVRTGTPATNSYTVSPALSTNTVYYWRVRATTPCGLTANSTVFRFAVLPAGSTTSYCRNGLNTMIPDNTTGGITDNLTVSGSGVIADINVSTTLTHTYVGDLVVRVISPATTAVTIVDRPGYTGTGFGCSNNHIRTVLDDEAVTSVEGICAAATGDDPPPYAIDGTYIPNNPLSALDGQNANGTWQLNISDRAGGDTGFLKAWCVNITTSTNSSADFSDLATSYGVAFHTGGGVLRLGPTWTADSTIPIINGDDPSDDGVVVDTTTNWVPGGSSSAILQVVGANGYATGWFDWNQNGQFDHPSEKAFGQNVTVGPNPIPFSIPASAVLSQPVRARFRLYISNPGAGESPVGGVADGEVEDYSAFAPLAVELADFEATRLENGVLVEWETAAEWDTLGFNLWRSDTADVPTLQLNSELIPSQAPGNGQGAFYEWTDTAAAPQQPYFYWLESIDLNGQTQFYGPVSVSESTPTAITMSSVASEPSASWAWLGIIGTLLILVIAALRKRK